MKLCTVSMIGKDGESHLVEVEASSLFDAAGRAVQQWTRMWWFQPDALIDVRIGANRWLVRQDRLRQARGPNG